MMLAVTNLCPKAVAERVIEAHAQAQAMFPTLFKVSETPDGVRLAEHYLELREWVRRLSEAYKSPPSLLHKEMHPVVEHLRRLLDESDGKT